jgi:ammonium transporter, Amt family
MVLDAIRGSKVTAIGAATAIIVGCVLITPAGGFVSPAYALALGAAGAIPCYAVVALRPRTRVDETLDVLAVHGIAGFIGILFIGFFAQKGWNALADGAVYGDWGQLGDQALAALAAPLYAFGMTFVLLKVIGLVMPLRSSGKDEALGMDFAYHGEEAYATGEGAILVTPEAGDEKPVPVAQP